MLKEGISRRKALRLLGFGATGVLLAACQPKEVEKVVKETVVVEEEVTRVVEKVEEPEPVSEPFELLIWAGDNWNQPSNTEEPYIQLVRERFAEKYPDVTLKFEDHGWAEELYKAMGVALMGGVGPDVIIGESFLKPYIRMGVFLALDEYVTDIREDLIPALNGAAEADGKLYGLAKHSNCFNLMANPNVLEKSGIDPDYWPEDWTEWLSTCQKITEAGDGDFYGVTVMAHGGGNYGAFMKWYVYMKQYGAEITKGDPPFPWFDNPETTPVYEFNRELYHYSPPGLAFNPRPAEMHAAVMQGLTAYHQVGTWQYSAAQEAGLESPKIGPIPIPDGGRDVSVLVANQIWSVLSTSDRPDAAAQFVRTLLQDDVQDLAFPALGHLPSRYSACERLKSKIQSSEENLWALPFVDSFLNAELFYVPQWETQPQLVWTTWNDMFRTILDTDDPIYPMQQEAQEKVEDILAEAEE